MRKFKSINYIQVNCEGCGATTSVEPGTEFSKLNCNCKPEKPKLNDTEISKPVQQELDYIKTQTVTVIGRFKDGDYEVCNGNDLSDTWRVPKDTFESTYARPKDTEAVQTDETPTTITNGEESSVSKGGGSLKDIKGLSVEDVKAKFTIDKLRTLAKSCKIRGYTNMGEDKLIGKLLKKAE